MLNSQCFECEIGGRNLIIETGKLAGQADAAVTVRYGDTIVLVTVCTTKEPREGVDFLPLTVDYEERLYAVGKIPGGFIRREGRPSQEAILACRLTDRPLRPLLPKTWRNEIQIIITVLSADQENAPDIMAIIGGSTVLSMSEVPFAGPVGACRVGYINGQYILNPKMAELANSSLDITVASTKDQVVMIEAGANEASEDIVFGAIKLAHEANQAIIKMQEQIQQALGKLKAEIPPKKSNEAATAALTSKVGGKLTHALSHTNNALREQALSELKEESLEGMDEFTPEETLTAFDAKIGAEIRAKILEQGQRVSGRGLTEIRPITCEVGLLPRTHGSGLFTRGQTQVLTIVTLGSTRKEQQLDGLGIEETKRFIHHYNMPPFSGGEVKRIGTPGRREIGHGALAERALEPMIPKDEDFPYTIRLVSEVVSSSGSTSMGSVCASSLSLMDAGIPIKRPVAGIAMGLVTGEGGKYAILTDIEGMEDNYGDMDFKVAGTTEGITAVQMDTKIHGLSMEIIDKTLTQAKDARLYILNIMKQTIEASRPELSKFAPRMYKITIAPDKIGTVIGPGGKTIRAISEENKVDINIENDGTVLIGSSDEASARKTIETIEGLTKDIEIGTIYTGKVVRLMSFGAFVEILPGKEGMVHISELSDHRVEKIEDEVKVGDEMTVMVIKNEDGKIGLSRKAVMTGQTPGEGSQEPSSDYPFRRGQRSPQSRPPQRRRY